MLPITSALGGGNNGYLGVDAFLVINGYFIIPKMLNQINEGTFKYFAFLYKRVLRLLPLILIVTAFCLCVGFWGMLPDDYENLSEAVVAANLLSTNILSYVTTGDYWGPANEYKPLMHTWYIGILFEFYLIFPILMLLVRRIGKVVKMGFWKLSVVILALLTLFSLVAYLYPGTGDATRFFLLPCRFFEIMFGGFAGLWVAKREDLLENKVLSYFSLIILLGLLFVSSYKFVSAGALEYNLVMGTPLVNENLIPPSVLLLATVFMATLFVMIDNSRCPIVLLLDNMKVFGLMGIASYSIYVWHQPLLAFYRYFFMNDLTATFLCMFAIVVAVISWLSYRFVEKRIKDNSALRVTMTAAFVIINSSTFAIYVKAGVVRDVPELGLFVGKDNRALNSQHSSYSDRIYDLDKNFPKDCKKMNVLIIGNSFMRDWGNILLESEYAGKMNLSYIFYGWEYDVAPSYYNRIKEADYVFFFDYKHNIPSEFWHQVKPSAQVWGIGTKNWGVSLGAIYKHRNDVNYYNTTVRINPNFYLINNQLKSEWGDKYVDLLSIIEQPDGSVRLFTDDNKFMTHDCEHLTVEGVKFFARKVDFGRVFGTDFDK